MMYQKGHLTPAYAKRMVENCMQFMIEDWHLIADLREIPVKPSDRAEMREALSIVMEMLDD